MNPNDHSDEDTTENGPKAPGVQAVFAALRHQAGADGASNDRVRTGRLSGRHRPPTDTAGEADAQRDDSLESDEPETS